MKKRRRMRFFRVGVLFLAVTVMVLTGFSVSGVVKLIGGAAEKPTIISSVSSPEITVIPVGSDPVETPEPVQMWTQAEVEAVAKTVYGEALITNSDEEMAAVVWCILNRVDSQIYPDTIMEVVTQRSQFHGYREENPVDPHIEELVLDVFRRWEAEKGGKSDVGRVLPAEYLFFWGDGWHNYFTTEYHGEEEWDWSLRNPYDT